MLLKAVDDATGAILAARFQPTEDLTGYFRLLTDVIQKHGLPVAVYTDRHRIFESPNETLTVEQELAGLSPQKTQFGLALEELGSSISKPCLHKLRAVLSDASRRHRTAGSLSSVYERSAPSTKETRFCPS